MPFRIALVLLITLNFGCAAGDKALVVYFNPGTLEMSQHDFNAVVAVMSSSEKYVIQGYSCPADKASGVEESLAIAEGRARKVKNILIDAGFSSRNLTTIAYGVRTDCRAVIMKLKD